MTSKPVPVLERDVEKYLCRRVKKAGGEVRKVQWLGRSSAPDRLVLLPGWAPFAELKRPGELPTPAQVREHQRMRRSGLHVEIITSCAAVDALIADWEGRMGV